MKIAILSSGEGQSLQALVQAQKENQLKAELCCLITDKADCPAAGAARANKVRVYYFDSRDVTPEVFEEQVVATLEFFKPDLILADGFAKPLSQSSAEKYGDRLKTLDSESPGDVVAMVKGLAK